MSESAHVSRAALHLNDPGSDQQENIRGGYAVVFYHFPPEGISLFFHWLVAEP